MLGGGSCAHRMTDKTQIALSRIFVAANVHQPIAVFGLFSGGHDSVTATAIASMYPKFTAALHINTGFGVQRTREYVYETAKARGWNLLEKRAVDNINAEGNPDPQVYRELVLKYGFPGPNGHGMMYARLKERCLRGLQRDFLASPERRVMYISGCRSGESIRRMAHTEEVQIDGQRIWVAPIHDWSASDCSEFMEQQQIARNPVVDLIHKSGECLCGAFAEKGELQELALWPETQPMYREIVTLEAEVRAEGFPWGWEDGPPDWWLEKKRGQEFLLDYDSDAPQHLCWSCNKRGSVKPPNERAEAQPPANAKT